MSRLEKWMLSGLNHGRTRSTHNCGSYGFVVGGRVFRLPEADWPQSLWSLCSQWA